MRDEGEGEGIPFAKRKIGERGERGERLFKRTVRMFAKEREGEGGGG